VKIDSVLTHELQLGEKLNHSVQQHRRADFSLMLAMLTDDVREYSQFRLPQTQSDTPKYDDHYYRKLFALPEPTNLAVNHRSQLAQFNQAELAQQQRFDDIRLRQALHAKPLAIRDDPHYIDDEIISNCSVHCQQRIKLATPETPILEDSEPLVFDAAQWLMGVKQSRKRQIA